MLKKTSFLLVAAILGAAPGIADHFDRRGGDYSATYAELAVLDDLVDQVRDPHLRHRMQERVDRAENALEREARDLRDSASRYDRGPSDDWDRTDRRGGDRDRTGDRDRGARDHLGYTDAKRLIDSAYFESDKVETVQHIGRNARLTTEEARALANLLYFESGKKDALVALYPAVTDKSRYMLAFDILYFGSSRSEVAEKLGL